MEDQVTEADRREQGYESERAKWAREIKAEKAKVTEKESEIE